MKTRSPLILFAALFGLLLAGSTLLAAQPTRAAAPQIAASVVNAEDETIRATAWNTVTCLMVSNEAHGYLVNALLAQGYGDQTFLQVLAYLKTFSNGIISDTFYNKAASAPAYTDVFYRLNDYSGGGYGVTQGFEICDNGWVWAPSDDSGRWFAANYPGWGLAPSQNGRFTLSYALNPSRNYCHLQVNYDIFCAFAIAWWDPKTIFLPLMTKN